ncbi:phytoene/squalene synthase family protein [Flavihumibacter sp. CACIAM 22H1]|uniref:phytoene/squalene synthase family protein n=1 Tax=Flavihumibacter sp. CACIAM 22H1 TaxID=1812911 RepID=UPI0007A7DF77|nr:phytoene/squalene synthase family protein [Flavihumibacter sp. CACIAM 22H1]KYP16023.1 MAG: phytoene synthase [Flavihumibacter sp. CACIAM 22H1]
MMQLFHTVCELSSKLTTERYSTSFSSAIKLLHHDLRQPIFNIYGFVRFADEIVDTFHSYDKETLIKEFKEQTYQAIDRKISLNPILHSFQLTVNQYNIDHELIEAFFRSMEMDLDQKTYDHQGYLDYIYGSAEVVGLMCLYVFCEGDRALYLQLKDQARSLGAAFQKVNFLRDLKADYNSLERVYFPGCDFSNFTACDKTKIEADIQQDFDEAYKGIMKLPVKARFGVYVAYKYYLSLFNRIKRVKPQRILLERIRIPNYRKAAIVVRAGVKNQLGMIG